MRIIFSKSSRISCFLQYKCKNTKNGHLNIGNLFQAFGIVDDPSHAYLNTSLFAIAGIYMFFFTDKLLKLIMEFKKVEIFLIFETDVWK